MSASQRHPEFVLLVAAVLLWGCGSTQPLLSLTPAPGPAVSTTSPSVSTATTTPSGGPIEPGVTGGGQIDEGEPAGLGEADPLLNHVVVTVSDGLRVRSEPRVSDDSIKYEPVLPLGTELAVLDGPVSASGYTWYKVAPVSFVGLEGPGYGWVALAGKDGEPWIALTEPPEPGIAFAKAGCPPVPTDVRTLRRLPHGARLVCFSGVPITIRARIVSCGCSVMPGESIEPSWFEWTGLGLVEPSKIAVAFEDSLAFAVDPAGRHPDVLPVDEVVDVTGMFDHPDAASCLLHTWEFALPVQSQRCRFAFAVTSLVAVQP